MEWSTFFAATAGASATLLGLLFVGIQLHLDIFSGDRHNRWRALARSTFDHYSALFVLSLLMLFPNPTRSILAVFILVVALPGLIRLVAVWAPVWRHMFQDQPGQFLEVLWLVASPLAAYLALMFLSVAILRGGSLLDLQAEVGYCVVGLFAIVLRNSWRLTVEVGAERRREAHGVKPEAESQ